MIQKEIAKTYSALKSTGGTPSLPTTNRRKKSKRTKKLLIRPNSSLNSQNKLPGSRTIIANDMILFYNLIVLTVSSFQYINM